jgi:hypothetical protein
MVSVIEKDKYHCSPASRSGIFWKNLEIHLPIHVQSNALSEIQQIQRYAIVFQIVLASYLILDVEDATYNSLIGHEDFLWTKKQQAICGNMMGRSSWQPYAQQGLGSTQSGPSGPLRSALEGAPMDVIHHSEIGTQNTMTEVTNHIQVLLNSTGRSVHHILNIMSVLWS